MYNTKFIEFDNYVRDRTAFMFIRDLHFMISKKSLIQSDMIRINRLYYMLDDLLHVDLGEVKLDMKLLHKNLTKLNSRLLGLVSDATEKLNLYEYSNIQRIVSKKQVEYRKNLDDIFSLYIRVCGNVRRKI